MRTSHCNAVFRIYPKVFSTNLQEDPAKTTFALKTAFKQ